MTCCAAPRPPTPHTPTGYTTEQWHPALYECARVLRTGAELRAWLAHPQEPPGAYPREPPALRRHTGPKTDGENNAPRRTADRRAESYASRARRGTLCQPSGARDPMTRGPTARPHDGPPGAARVGPKVCGEVCGADLTNPNIGANAGQPRGGCVR
ncbi:hypothetical protein tb265_26180 [Gemmatimonadetes bacterium T265]|nr:hypothetical protein tb265_26180 [Gemmatimonadetes bacterium T265]